MSIISSFQDYMKNGLEDIIQDFTKDGNCSKCGNCCSNVLPMTKKELDRIKKYIRANNIAEIKHITPLAKAPIDMTCPFRNDTKEICTIYEVRPKICRSFICNDVSQAKRNREHFAATMRIVDVRKELFNTSKQEKLK
jgi:Fe-S-cluster containining protein